jgi:hypothetical protein
MMNRMVLFVLVFVLSLASGCTKSFLSPKPSSDFITPDSLADFQSLMNNQLMIQTPALPILSADEYYYPTYNDWQLAPTATERNSYLWAENLYNGENPIDDWNTPYQQIFYANVVIAGLQNVSVAPTNTSQYNLVLGWAYFSRAFALYNLVSEFGALYDSATAANSLGVPIRTTADINVIEPRSSVQQTYQQIFSDLDVAEQLLPAHSSSGSLNIPSKTAIRPLSSMRTVASRPIIP